MHGRLAPILTLALLLGCHREAAPPAATPAPPAPARSKQTYTLRGVVRSVDPHDGVVTIAHEAIPGFMGAMTMPFTPRDRSNLDEIRPGDEVEGPLEVVREGDSVKDYDLLLLDVTHHAPGAPDPAKAAGVALLKPGEEVPDFAVTTQDGTRLKLSDLRGKVVVFTFIYTRCPLPDYCPAVDRKFRRLAERLSAVKGRAEGVRLLSISFDPEHDTPEKLRAHAKVVGAEPPLWTFAVASHEELAKVGPRLGLAYGPTPGEIVHNLVTAVVAPDGTLARLDSGAAGKAWDPEEILRAALGAGGGRGDR